jgi:hypothetical protein
MIPPNITKEHIVKAIEEIDNGRPLPTSREPHRHLIEHNGKTYPPKFAISLANKYANGTELAPDDFHSHETNNFLKSRGFEIIPYNPPEVTEIKSESDPENNQQIQRLVDEEAEGDYAPVIMQYLERQYKVQINKIARSSLELPSGTVIMAKGSNRKQPWFGLDRPVYEELTRYPKFFLALALGDPNIAFIIPQEKVRTIFETVPTKKRPGRDTERWLFRMFNKDGRYFLKVNLVDAVHDMQPYLNNWNQIQDFAGMQSAQAPDFIEKPVNSEDDATPLTFVDLKRFLLQKMKPRANYQPVMIKTLLENGGRCTKDQIVRKLREFNTEETADKDFKSVPVYSVLEDHHIVRKEAEDSYILNTVNLSSEQVLHLTLLCNWLIPEHPLQLNELAGLFDKDRNFFAEERPSAEEIENQRRQFVSDFSEQKVPTMKLDEYVIGKDDRTTFCYRLEITLQWIGSIRGSYAYKFGIFYNEKRGKYAYDEKKYRSAEEQTLSSSIAKTI